jgi:hypothetical protein
MLKEAEDEYEQVSHLRDLIDIISISTEEHIAVFPIEPLILILVRLLLFLTLKASRCTGALFSIQIRTSAGKVCS